jgi:hypothetical protein
MGGDDDGAALGHGIARIDHQIEQGAFKAGGIDEEGGTESSIRWW